MDTAVLLSETRGGRLTTPDGGWQFATKVLRPPLDRWIGKLWELDGGSPPARERELPRGDISLIINLEGRHAVVDAIDPRREHVFKDAWVTGLQERAFLTASGGRAWLCGARLTVEGAYRSFGVGPRELTNTIVDLDALHGGAARTLVDAVRSAPSADRRLTLLGSYIAEHAAHACKWDGAVEWALQRIATTRGCVSVLSLARRSAGAASICIAASSIKSGSGPRPARSSHGFTPRCSRWSTIPTTVSPPPHSGSAISIRHTWRVSSVRSPAPRSPTIVAAGSSAPTTASRARVSHIRPRADRLRRLS